MRRGEPFRLDYPEGERSESIAAVPFSQLLGPGEDIVVVGFPFCIDPSRRWNRLPMVVRDTDDGLPPMIQKDVRRA